MTLATLDRITFYSSPDLKNWTKESEFGKTLGAHGGVWECPDLFPMKLNGKTRWILIVNINPGGPNGGSATQYFVGNFNGAEFVPTDDKIRWLDYGPDEYAGVTWHNTANRRIFLGWMSNWEYATQVPTQPWRSAMTIPRNLALKEVDADFRLASEPVSQLNSLGVGGRSFKNIIIAKKEPVTLNTNGLAGQYELKLKTDQLKSFSLTLSNSPGEKLVIGYNAVSGQYYIDRSQSGKVDFQKNFAGRFTAPRLVSSPADVITLVFDRASVELFASEGLSVMTCTFFPNKPYNKVQLASDEGIKFNDITYSPLKSAW